MKDVTITLSPHDAMILAAFHHEALKNYDVSKSPALSVAINNYIQQIVSQMDDSQIEDAHAEINVNILTGRLIQPPINP